MHLLLLLACQPDKPSVDSGDLVLDSDPQDCEEQTWYEDLDQDGFGSDTTIEACEPPADFTDQTGDCDDDDPAVNPDAEEICDGQDNDCDGTIDGPDSVDAQPWYADADGDGYGDPDSPVTDCAGQGLVDNDEDCDDDNADTNPEGVEDWYDEHDSDCDGELNPDICEELPQGDWYDGDESCTYTPTTPENWEIDVEWSTDPASGWTWSTQTNSTRVMMTPVVGQITDDNGDGVIDEYDTPDILFNTFWGSSWASYGTMRAVSGDGSGEHWSTTSLVDGSLIQAAAGIAIGDIDNDGSPDILTMGYYGTMLALEADGTHKWTSEVNGLSPYGYPTITDMDGDGLAELIVGTTILDHTGALVSEAVSGHTIGAFAADLNGDGVLEHIGGNSVTQMDGTVLWEDSDSSPGIPAVMDWDGDGDGDVLNSQGEILTVYDESGNILVEETLPSSVSGAPCVGDLDGDGEPEVAMTGASAIVAMETDGTVMWTQTAYDPSTGGTPCTTWDFDGDGDFEVLVADEIEFRILDGTDGSELLLETGLASGTLFEQPVPVDVDRDGATEIVLANNDYYHSGWDGIYVLGEVNDEWTTTRTVWNQGPYWSGNVESDLSIPTAMDMPWDLDNSFRSQLSPTAEPLATQDYEVEILGVCEDCEEGSVEVYVSPMNSGATWGPKGVEVALYAGGELVEIQDTTASIDPGERLPPMTFHVPVQSFNSGEVQVFIDHAEEHNECDEDNNAATWNESVCE